MAVPQQIPPPISLYPSQSSSSTSEQEGILGKHKIKILTVVAILGVITCVALAILFWPVSFGCIGALVIAHGIALMGLPITAKIGIVAFASGLTVGAAAKAAKAACIRTNVEQFKTTVLRDLKEIFGEKFWKEHSLPAQMVPFCLTLADFNDKELNNVNKELLNLAMFILPNIQNIPTFKKAYQDYPVDTQTIKLLKEKQAEWNGFLEKEKDVMQTLGHTISSSVRNAIISVIPGFEKNNEHLSGAIVGNMFMIQEFWDKASDAIDKNELFQIALTVSPFDDISDNLKLFSKFLQFAHDKTVEYYNVLVSDNEKTLNYAQFVKVFEIASQLEKIYHVELVSVLVDFYNQMSTNPKDFDSYLNQWKRQHESKVSNALSSSVIL